MRRLFFSGIAVAVGIFAGRISGFIREMIIGATYGASSESDLIIVLLSVPDILINMLVGGALTIALVPEFQSNLKQNARYLYIQILFAVLILFSVIAIVLCQFSASILSIIAPGLSAETINIGSNFLQISIFAIPLTVAAGVTTAFLNYENKFFVPSLGTLIFNGVLILALLYSVNPPSNLSLLIITSSVIVAAAVRWVALLMIDSFSLFQKGAFEQVLITNNIVKRYVYAVLSGGFVFLVPVIIRASSSNHGDGYLSIFNYAIKLIELPLAVVLTVFSMVFLPKMSKFSSDENMHEFSVLIFRLCMAVLFLSLLICASFVVLSGEVVDLVYGWGQLNDDKLEIVSNIFVLALPSLIFQGLNSILIAALAAKRDTISSLISSSSLVLLLILAVYFLAPSIEELVILMNLFYLLSTASLTVFLKLKHKISLKIGISFWLEILKIFAVILIHYEIVSFINSQNLVSFVSLTLCSISGLFCLGIYYWLSSNFRNVFYYEK